MNDACHKHWRLTLSSKEKFEIAWTVYKEYDSKLAMTFRRKFQKFYVLKLDY